MNVQAKMVCTAKINHGEGQAGEVNLMAVADGSEESKRFFEATPWGHVKLGILNPTAYGSFREGATYLVTFEEA